MQLLQRSYVVRLVLQVEHCEEVMLVSGYKEEEQVQLNIYKTVHHCSQHLHCCENLKSQISMCLCLITKIQDRDAI